MIDGRQGRWYVYILLHSYFIEGFSFLFLHSVLLPSNFLLKLFLPTLLLVSVMT